MKLKIGFQSIAVRPFALGLSAALEARGMCDHAAHTIFLDATMPAAEQAEVLIHEILHGCFETFGWPDEGLTEEDVCTRVGKGLAIVLHDNPAIHATLHQALCQDKEIV